MAESYSVTAYLKAYDANFSKQFNEAKSTVEKFQTKAGNAMAKVSKAVATATKVAGVAMAAFGTYGIKSAADMRVMEAQYEQAFNGVSSEADSMVSSMSKSFNMLPERLKAPMSSFQSYFKGTGMEVNKSLSATEKAMTIAADASAYYDKSIEETSASLKGMLMGNYENGDSLGVNTNATKIAAQYNKDYGGSFDDLAESQKQNYILEYVEDIYALNGVMGQGTREGHEFENVFANLRSTVATFAGKVMEPFMDPLIAAMEKASGWLSTADEKFFAFVETIKNSNAFQSLQQVVQTAMDKVKEFSQSSAFETIKQAFADVGQAILDIDFVSVVESLGEFLDKWGPTIAGVITGIAAFKAITAVVDAVKNSIALFNAVILLIQSPIGLAALAIGALVVAGIYLWKNWDTIKAKATELWESVKEKFNALKESVSTAIENTKLAVSNKFNEMKTAAINKASELKNSAINKFNELKTGASNAIQNAKNAVSNKFSEMKTAAVNKAQEIKIGAINKFNEMKNGVSNKVQEAKNAVSQKFQEIVNSVRDKMNDAVGKVKEIGGGIKDFFEGIDLYASGKAIIQSAIDGLVAMKDKITGKVSEIAGAVRDFWPFSPAKTGPLSDIHKMDFAGPIGMSVDKARKPLNKAMESLASSARNGFDPQLNIQSGWNPDALNISRTARNLNGSVSQTVSQNVNLNDGALINSLKKLVNSRGVVVLNTGELVGATYNEYDKTGGNTTKLSQRWGR